MRTTDTQSLLSWTLLCLLLNVLFAGHGMLLLVRANAGSGLAWVGLAAIAYGLVNSLVLLAAWLFPLRATTVAAAVLATGYAVTLVAAAWLYDLAAQFALLAGMAILLALVGINVLAIHRVQSRASTG